MSRRRGDIGAGVEGRGCFPTGEVKERFMEEVAFHLGCEVLVDQRRRVGISELWLAWICRKKCSCQVCFMCYELHFL